MSFLLQLVNLNFSPGLHPPFQWLGIGPTPLSLNDADSGHTPRMIHNHRSLRNLIKESKETGPKTNLQCDETTHTCVNNANDYLVTHVCII